MLLLKQNCYFIYNFMNLYTSVCQVVRDVVDILDTLLLEWDPDVVEDQGSE